MLWNELYAIIEANPGVVQSELIKASTGGANNALVAMDRAGWIIRVPIPKRTYRLYPKKGGQKVHGNVTHSQNRRDIVREQVKKLMKEQPRITLNRLVKEIGRYTHVSTFYHQFRREGLE